MSRYGSQYKLTHLFKDIGGLVQLKGLDLLADVLQSANNKRFRYELKGAAWLKRNQNSIDEITKRIDGTDIDVVVREGSKVVYY